MSRRTALTAVAALTLGAGLAVLPTQAQAATVVVSNSTDLSNAIKNATAGTVIQVRAGTYYPTATLQSTANGTSSSPVTLTAYGSETVKIDGSSLPDGDWIFKLTADYWNVSNITFQNSPDSAVVCSPAPAPTGTTSRPSTAATPASPSPGTARSTTPSGTSTPTATTTPPTTERTPTVSP